MTKTNQESKPWPTDQDLLAWCLFLKLDAVPPELLVPELIKGWIAEFQTQTAVHWHQYLWNQEITEFNAKFAPPDV